MTTEDDDLERRLRGALGRPQPPNGLDADDFLARVHHGAKVRRVKRGVGTAVAGVLVVAGGGLAIDANGFFDHDRSPVADGSTTHTAPPSTNGTFSTEQPSTTPSQTRRSTSSSPPPTSGTPEPPATKSVTITPNGPISAADVTPLSLTATGTAKQFVLAKTPGDACGRKSCATVLSTTDHGSDGSWNDLGALPASPPEQGVPTPETVSQLRFALRTDGSHIYDGWAFGNALWSTHDSGTTWVDSGAALGSVTQVEAWGDYVYAGASSLVPGDDTATLYRSPTSSDTWEPVEVSKRGLTSVQAIAAANGLVGLIDMHSDGHTKVFISQTGDSGSWTGEGDACPAGSDPVSLSAASEEVNLEQVTSLWVKCQGATEATVRYTNTAAPGMWHDVPAKGVSPSSLVAAQSASTGIVADNDQLTKISLQQGPLPVVASSFGVPTFLGFTNDRYGYLLDSDGTILATTDGGKTWQPYTVSGIN